MTDQNLQIRKAQRKKAKLRLGLSAPSGAGKTFGALVMAFGLLKEQYSNLPDEALWEKIGMVDTEEGSGELYVGATKTWKDGEKIKIGEYNYLRLSAPFTAVKYLHAQRTMEDAGIEVIIEDSLTHAWSGTGGLLEKQGRITDMDPKKNSYTAWRHVTPDHNALVDAILQSPAHIICTMRSKVEYSLQVGKGGKQEVVKLGLAPIQREGMEYEFTVFFDIDANGSIASASKDRTDLFTTVNASGFLEKRQFIITPAIGAELSRWLNTGIESLDSACDRLAREIAVSDDLAATYTEFAGVFARIESERPDWMPLMQAQFEARAEEISKNTA